MICAAGIGYFIASDVKELTQPTPLPTPAVSPSPRIVREPVAQLKTHEPTTRFRWRDTLNWQDVVNEMKFYENDALSTHEKAKAHVILKRGSNLDLGENTMVIFNSETLGRLSKDPENVDSAIVRGGALSTSTQNELWLLTSSMLLKMSAQKGGKPAQAKLTVKEGDKVKVKLQQGAAKIVHKDPKSKIVEVPLKIDQEVSLKAPTLPEDFGRQAVDLQQWMSESLPNTEVHVEKAKPKPEEMAQGGLIIDSPANRAVLSGAKTVFQGKLTTKGKLFLDNKPVRIGTDLRFRHEVALRMGTNTFTFEFTRSDGSTVVKVWTLVRKK